METKEAKMMKIGDDCAICRFDKKNCSDEPCLSCKPSEWKPKEANKG